MRYDGVLWLAVMLLLAGCSGSVESQADGDEMAVGIFDGISPDMRNNLGPDSAGNLVAQANYFVNAAGGNFHLMVGSDPIDAGEDVGITVDIEGTARPQGGGFDIGAYEFKTP